MITALLLTFVLTVAGVVVSIREHHITARAIADDAARREAASMARMLAILEADELPTVDAFASWDR